jgi:hypothetical protein
MACVAAENGVMAKTTKLSGARGWTKTGEAVLYKGRAIFDSMDGAGEVFLAYNFRNLSSRSSAGRTNRTPVFRNQGRRSIFVRLLFFGDAQGRTACQAARSRVDAERPRNVGPPGHVHFAAVILKVFPLRPAPLLSFCRQAGHVARSPQWHGRLFTSRRVRVLGSAGETPV